MLILRAQPSKHLTVKLRLKLEDHSNFLLGELNLQRNMGIRQTPNEEHFFFLSSVFVKKAQVIKVKKGCVNVLD